jgi:hypothetical protein
VALVQAGLAALTATDAVELPDERVRSEVLALLSCANQLTAALAERIGTFDARDLAQTDALRTTRTWLTGFGRMSQGAATAHLNRARLLRALPALAAAARAGDVSAEHLAKVGQLAERVGLAAVREFDEVLAKAASSLSMAHLQRACERVAAHLDPDGQPPDPDDDLRRREVTFSRLGSMLYLRGRLDPEGGAALMTAVDALMRPPAPGDERTSAQRRADALIELARGAIAGGGLPTVGGVRPHLGILITPQTLLGAAAGADHGRDSHHGESQPGRQNGGGRPGVDADRGRDSGADSGADSGRDGGDGLTDMARGLATALGVLTHWKGPESRHYPSGPGSTGLATFRPNSPSGWPATRSSGASFSIPRPGCRWTSAGSTGLCQRGSARQCTHATACAGGQGATCPPTGPTVITTCPGTSRGTTDVKHLISLCRWHHGLVHEGRWKLTLDHATGEVSVIRPDGTPYELGPSQPWTMPSRQGPSETVSPSSRAA